MSAPADPREALLARAGDALAQLSELRCHDPAAAAAMRAIGLTRYTLDHFWIPTLERQLGRSNGPTEHDV